MKWSRDGVLPSAILVVFIMMVTNRSFFDADATQNYLADSFGLTGFVSPMIKREDFKQKLEHTIRQQRDEKQRKLHTNPTPKSRTRNTGTKTEPVF